MRLSEPDRPDRKNRAERVELMRNVLVAAKSAMDDGESLTKAQEEELLLWAGLEFAAVEHLLTDSQRVMLAIHPSLNSDKAKLDSEVVMYLIQCAGTLAARTSLPIDTLVRALAVYHKNSGMVGAPEADEREDFERTLWKDSN